MNHWHQGLQNLNILTRLSSLTARLLHITTYNKLTQFEIPFKSAGIKLELTTEYRKYASTMVRNLKIKQETKRVSYLRMKADKGNTF